MPEDPLAARPAGAGLSGVPVVEHLHRADRLAATRTGDIGAVHSWELVTAVDGPGTRLTLFLAGCPLRCLYCQNPDTWWLRNGSMVRVDDVLLRLDRYREVLAATGGGLTLSGGEPLLQPAFAGRLLRAAADRGVHTAVDTSGFMGANATDAMLDDIDLVLLDVKSGDERTYRKVTGRTLQPTLDFGNRLARRLTPVWVRFVLVPGLTDAERNVDDVARIVRRWPNVERVEVLPFHQMAKDKWTTLGLSYRLESTPPPTPELVDRVREQLRSHGLTTY
jgi:pyruvate formate lyase activating enzyme